MDKALLESALEGLPRIIKDYAARIPEDELDIKRSREAWTIREHLYHIAGVQQMFHGTTEEAFNFYKSVFGGEFTYLQRFKDAPESEKIMHVSLPLGNDLILMGTDALESMGQKLTVGNNFYISVEAESREAADKFGIQWMIDYTYKK